MTIALTLFCIYFALSETGKTIYMIRNSDKTKFLLPKRSWLLRFFDFGEFLKGHFMNILSCMKYLSCQLLTKRLGVGKTLRV